MFVFYCDMLESIIQHEITAWFQPVQLRNKLVHVHKTAMKIISVKIYKPIQTIYKLTVIRTAEILTTDHKHNKKLSSGRKLGVGPPD